MINSNKKLLCIGLIIFLIFLINTSATAVSPNFQIKPSRFEILLEPRGRIIETINISNMGEEPLNLVATPQDWVITANGDLNLMEPSTSHNSASNWIRFNPKKIEVKPGKSQVIRFAITAPPQVEPGEYRTSILLTAEETIETDIQVKIKPQFAILVYVNIPEVKRKGEITDFTISANDSGEYLGAGNINSTGNAHLRISGEYLLQDDQGKEVTTKDLEKKVILAGDSEEFKANLGQLDAGSYKLKFIWHYIPAFYMEGEYDEYPRGEKSLIREYKFSVDD